MGDTENLGYPVPLAKGRSDLARPTILRGATPQAAGAGNLVDKVALDPSAPNREYSAVPALLNAWLDGGAPPLRTRPILRVEGERGTLWWPAPPGVVTLDRQLTARLRPHCRVVEGGDAPAGALSAPNVAQVRLTSRCAEVCHGCHVDQASPRDADFDALQIHVAELAKLGVFEVVVGGGEVLLAEGLRPTLELIRDLGMVAHVSTPGFSLCDEHLPWLVELCAQINVSLDGIHATYTSVRGIDRSDRALDAIRRLVQAGGRVGVNTQLTANTVDMLPQIAELLAGSQMAEWRWIRVKPASEGVEDFIRRHPTHDQLGALWPLAVQLQSDHGLPIRFDCALYPFLAIHGLDADTMSSAGLRGCSGAFSILARDEHGQWAACPFAPNRIAGSPSAAWRTAEGLTAWREASPSQPCEGCEHVEVCRGGCRVIAEAITGDPAAGDPWCPRVIAHGTEPGLRRRAGHG